MITYIRYIYIKGFIVCLATIKCIFIHLIIYIYMFMYIIFTYACSVVKSDFGYFIKLFAPFS